MTGQFTTMRVRVNKTLSNSIRALGKANGKTPSEMAAILLEDALALREVAEDSRAKGGRRGKKSGQA